jgi:hypothetical protein
MATQTHPDDFARIMKELDDCLVEAQDLGAAITEAGSYTSTSVADRRATERRTSDRRQAEHGDRL